MNIEIITAIAGLILGLLIMFLIVKRRLRILNDTITYKNQLIDKYVDRNKEYLNAIRKYEYSHSVKIMD